MIAADQQVEFSSKNLGDPLPNQGSDSCSSLAPASNGKRIDNGYCWIVYFKEERSCETRPSLHRHGTSGYSDAHTAERAAEELYPVGKVPSQKCYLPS
jgi:hypothetical protein